MNKIDTDPMQEAHMYAPARANPFDNVVFIKNALASGSIMPPRDGVDSHWRFAAPLLTMFGIGGILALLIFCR